MRETIENILKPPVKKKQKKDQKEVSETKAVKDLARLLTLYTIGTLFFPTTGPNLNWFYHKLVEDLENSANYNWSEFITNYLVNELNSKNPKIVGGCTTALLVKQPELELTEQERGLFAPLVLHEQEGRHKEQQPETQDENPQEENQDVKNLILELQQRIEVLEKENDVMKVEIEDKDKKIQEKELLIVELHQNVESLQNELSGYRKQSANYTDTEKETCSLHFEVEMLKEDIIENQVEIEATEEEVDQTIKFTISSINAETQQTTKKRLRKSHTVDPSSLTKRVNKREDRKEKNMDDFQVYGKKKNKEKPTEKEKPAEKAAPELQYMGVETTKLAHLVSENDKIFLNHVFECEKDIGIPIWDNNLSNGTVSLQEAIEILNEGDVQNTLIDSFTFMLEREQGDESKILFFKSSLWVSKALVLHNYLISVSLA
ncbi:hypothetical protein RHMOL_Rhmol13G0147000 [Rhododendron molle]|uniref:Uncharacterized protein n=1 Tax=Rhododendron molle TaxID=49168 RepID=A0ACC0L6V2_RHOML|nr:hypothetical protein RHMOL_Rhmol13G0147000 [Rhododendron molle]